MRCNRLSVGWVICQVDKTSKSTVQMLSWRSSSRKLVGVMMRSEPRKQIKASHKVELTPNTIWPIEWSEALTDDDLPVLGSIGHFVSTPHLGIGHSSQDENNQTRNVFDVERVLLLVPVSVAHASWCWSTVVGRCRTTSQKLKVLVIQLVLNSILSM